MPKITKLSKVNMGKLTENIEKQEAKKGFTKDEDIRIYKPKLKKDGTFTGIIRFLPSLDTDVPYVKTFKHWFLGPAGKWFVEECPTTLGQSCHCCTANSLAWKAGDKDTSRRRMRKLNVFANVLIVKDPQSPENEGKVFLFRFGTKIHEKVLETIKGSDVDEPINIFDPIEGANFKLVIKQVGGYANYDSSKFTSPSKIGTDKEIDTIGEQIFTLSEFLDPGNFKSEDELEEKFNKVEGLKSDAKTETKTTSTPDKDPGDSDEPELNDDFIKQLEEQE